MQGRKRVYLHIGQDKAGSTAIQTFLAQNYAQLVELGYDSVGGKVKHHGPVQAAAASGDAAALAEVTRYIQASPADNHIMSFEGFYALEDEVLARLLSPLREFQLVAVLYVRRRSDKFRSGFAQNLKLQKAGQVDEARTVVNGEVGSLKPARRKNMDYLGIVRRWQQHFADLGPDNEFRLRVYEKSSFADGDLLTDFGRCIDVLGEGQSLRDAALKKPEMRSNPSLSPAAQYLTIFSKALQPTEEQAHQLGRILAAADEAGANRGSMISDRVAKSLDRKFARDDKVLAKEFFGRSKLFREPLQLREAWPQGEDFTRLINALAQQEDLFGGD